MSNQPIKTKMNEVRIRTLDPKELLNKFLVNDLTRKWPDTFIDTETQKPVTIQRTEIILTRGTLLNAQNMMNVNFHIQSGDITEPIEVSDQSRQGHETWASHLRPFTCNVSDGREKKKYLLLASSVEMATDITRDYCELHYNGQFAILEVKKYEPAIILVDNLSKLSQDEAQIKYLQGEIPFEEFMDEVTEGLKKPDHEDDEPQIERKFYQIKAAISKDGERDPEPELFIVLSADADRAIMTINAWLQAAQRKHNRDCIERDRAKDIDESETVATIEECKIVNFAKLIPRQISEAYEKASEEE